MLSHKLTRIMIFVLFFYIIDEFILKKYKRIKYKEFNRGANFRWYF